MQTPTSASAAPQMSPGDADIASRRAAIALALTLPGDTLLYLLLPIYASSFGVSLPEAGVLLAANRLVRIAGYGWIARGYARFGARTSCIVAACGAAAATSTYYLFSGVWLLLIGRLLWGLSFAAMNIANQALPTGAAQGAAQRSGLSRAIIATGPAIGLIAGAVLAEVAGPRSVFLALTLLSCLAPFVAARIPIVQERVNLSGPRFERPSAISLWSFSQGFTLDGIFIFGLGLLAAANYPKGAVLAAGIALSLRYITEVGFAPVGGRLAQRYGARRILVLSSYGAAAGLFVLAADGWILWCAAVVTIVLRAIAQPLAAPMVAEAFPGPERVRELARQATWRDIGAGTGPLVAGVLTPIAPAFAIYATSAAVLAAASLMLFKAGHAQDSTKS